MTLSAVGDIMLGTHFPSTRYLHPRPEVLLQPADSLLSISDVAFGNLEGVLLDDEIDSRKCKSWENCYAFKSPESYGALLASSGLDIMGVANNHVNDFSALGRQRTMSTLDAAGLGYAGMQECPTYIMDVTLDSLTTWKVGLCAFAPNSGCMQLLDFKRMARIISELDTLCDIVIVSYHMGAEGQAHAHITKETEMFLGENRGNPYEIARWAIDHGADVILGHGPHVPRAVDLYRDRFITYSMGNFATYARFNLKGSLGYAPLFRLTLNQDGSLVEGQIHSFLQVGEGGPNPDAEQRAARQLELLTQEALGQSLEDLRLTY